MYSKSLLVLGLLFVSAYSQQYFDAAKVKLDNAINILNTATEEGPVVIQAVVTGVDAIFGGNLIVLPSKLTLGGKEESSSLKQGYPGEGIRNPMADFERGPKGFNATINDIDSLISAMQTYLGMNPIQQQPMEGQAQKLLEAAETLISREVILTAMDLLLFTKEILLNLARYTVRCTPNMDFELQGDYCKLFLQTDEIGSVLDEVLMEMETPMTRYFREIRSPLFAIQSSPLSLKTKNWQTGTLGSGDCTAIVKEVPGLKAVFRVATISMWNFPWLASSPILGKQTFVFEWVPAQYIKTISLCNVLNPTTQSHEMIQTVNTETVLHRGLLHLWNLMPVTSQ